MPRGRQLSKVRAPRPGGPGSRADRLTDTEGVFGSLGERRFVTNER